MELTILPKYPPRPKKTSWFNLVISLAAYIGIGLLVFPNSLVILTLTLIVLLHEAGHLLAMRAYRYTDTGILFIPFLGGLATGTKRELSQRQSAVILMAGPIPGILIGTTLLCMGSVSDEITWAGKLFVLLNGLNLLPIYPFDGGQLFNRIFLEEEGWRSNIFKFCSAVLLAFVAVQYKLYPLLLFPLFQLWQLRPDKVGAAIDKVIREENIPTNLDYTALPDEDYWKLRAILIRLHPACKEISPQTDQYDENEQKVQLLIESLLDRNLIQDLSIFGKLAIGAIWMGALSLTAYFLMQ